jgi:hypothetical protein
MATPSPIERKHVEECHTGSTDVLNLWYIRIVYHTSRPPHSTGARPSYVITNDNRCYRYTFTIVIYLFSKTNYEETPGLPHVTQRFSSNYQLPAGTSFPLMMGKT